MKTSIRIAGLLTLLTSHICNAQAPITTQPAKWLLGISGGYTNNEFYTNISNYNGSYYRREGGFVVSLPLRYAIADWCAVQAEPELIQKSFSLWQEGQTAQPTHLTSRYNYLQLPLMAHFSFGAGRWHGFLNLGAYASYWLSGRIKGNEPDAYNQPFLPKQTFFLAQDVDGRYDFESRRDRRLQAGWLMGIGLEYSINERLKLFAEGRYYQDITDQQKKYMRQQMPRYNLTTSITAGILAGFPRLKKR